jgi:hypothetical protein
LYPFTGPPIPRSFSPSNTSPSRNRRFFVPPPLRPDSSPLVSMRASAQARSRATPKPSPASTSTACSPEVSIAWPPGPTAGPCSCDTRRKPTALTAATSKNSNGLKPIGWNYQTNPSSDPHLPKTQPFPLMEFLRKLPFAKRTHRPSRARRPLRPPLQL